MQDMKDDPAETSPLLSSGVQQQDDESRLDAIAGMVVNRSLNTETDAVFTKDEIVEAMTLNPTVIDPSLPIEEAATEWISAAMAAGTLPIVHHNQDEEILHILAQQTSNLTNQPSTSQGTTSGLGPSGTRPIASDVSTQSVSSTHSSHSKRSRKKKRQQIEEMKLKIARRIASNCINQDTGERYSFQFILNEINDLEFNIRLDRSVEQQGL